MTVVEILRFFRFHGLDLKGIDGRLKFSAPRGLVGEQVLAGLKAHKDEIIGLLERGDVETLLEQDERRAARGALSFAQQRLWFLEQLRPGSPDYNMPTALQLDGALDVDALRRTLNEIVRRHEALRTRFDNVAGTPVQVVDAPYDLALAVSDLRGEPARATLARELAQQEALRGFDLARGPLLRARLLRLDDAQHVLLFTLHHIVSDGWSMAVLLREVAVLYRAFVAGHPSPLPALPLQYADHARWERIWQGGAVLQGQLDYWRAQLAGAPAALALPTDRPRPQQQTHAGALHRATVDTALTAALTQLAHQRRATLFMVLAAAFNVLLARYSGDDDICIGTPVANRRRAETEGLIGCFANTLVLRTRVDAGASFETLLQQVRATTLDAYANQDAPFEQLVDLIRPERDASRSPLFQVMLVLQNGTSERFELPGVTLQPVEITQVAAKFDLTLNVAELGAGLALTVEYNTDLFDGATMARMLDHFVRLLAAVAQAPGTTVAALPMLDATERHQLLHTRNATASPYPAGCCVHELFEEQAARTPHAVAAVFEDHRLTYAELNERSNRLAHCLRAHGVQAGQLVGLCLERSLELVIGVLGILKAGAAYVPLDPNHPPARLGEICAGSGLALVLTQERWRQLVCTLEERHGVEGFSLDGEAERASLQCCGGGNPGRQAGQGPDSLAYVIHTSGSTGQPKGVMVEHRALTNRIAWMQREYPLTCDDVVLQKTPFNFDVSVWELTWPFIAGARLVIARPDGHKDPDYLVQLIRTTQVTTLHFVPSMFRHMVAHTGWRDCTSVRQVFCSGEALGADLVSAHYGAHRAPLHNLYGPTEAAIDVTYWRCPPDAAIDTVPIGRPIQNTALYVLGRHLELQPEGTVGELYIGGVGLARGYVNQPRLTAERFIPNPFHDAADPSSSTRLYRTGDRVRYLADGNLEYLGRFDDQVKLRGVRIEPGEIEQRLVRHAEVVGAVVLVRADRPGEQRLVAYVIPRDASLAGTPAWSGALREHLRRALPETMVPALFVALPAFPLTVSGKIDRKALPVPEETDFAPPYVAPRTETERQLAAICAELLQLPLEQVSATANFLELGGDSMSAVRLVSFAASHGLELSLEDVLLESLQELARLAAPVAMPADDGARPAAPDHAHVIEAAYPDGLRHH